MSSIFEKQDNLSPSIHKVPMTDQEKKLCQQSATMIRVLKAIKRDHPEYKRDKAYKFSFPGFGNGYNDTELYALFRTQLNKKGHAVTDIFYCGDYTQSFVDPTLIIEQRKICFEIETKDQEKCILDLENILIDRIITLLSDSLNEKNIQYTRKSLSEEFITFLKELIADDKQHVENLNASSNRSKLQTIIMDEYFHQKRTTILDSSSNSYNKIVGYSFGLNEHTICVAFQKTIHLSEYSELEGLRASLCDHTFSAMHKGHPHSVEKIKNAILSRQYILDENDSQVNFPWVINKSITFGKFPSFSILKKFKHQIANKEKDSLLSRLYYLQFFHLLQNTHETEVKKESNEEHRIACTKHIAAVWLNIFANEKQLDEEQKLFRAFANCIYNWPQDTKMIVGAIFGLFMAWVSQKRADIKLFAIPQLNKESRLCFSFHTVKKVQKFILDKNLTLHSFRLAFIECKEKLKIMLNIRNLIIYNTLKDIDNKVLEKVIADYELKSNLDAQQKISHSKYNALIDFLVSKQDGPDVVNGPEVDTTYKELVDQIIKEATGKNKEDWKSVITLSYTFYRRVIIYNVLSIFGSTNLELMDSLFQKLVDAGQMYLSHWISYTHSALTNGRTETSIEFALLHSERILKAKDVVIISDEENIVSDNQANAISNVVEQELSFSKFFKEELILENSAILHILSSCNHPISFNILMRRFVVNCDDLILNEKKEKFYRDFAISILSKSSDKAALYDSEEIVLLHDRYSKLLDQNKITKELAAEVFSNLIKLTNLKVLEFIKGKNTLIFSDLLKRFVKTEADDKLILDVIKSYCVLMDLLKYKEFKGQEEQFFLTIFADLFFEKLIIKERWNKDVDEASQVWVEFFLKQDDGSKLWCMKIVINSRLIDVLPPDSICYNILYSFLKATDCKIVQRAFKKVFYKPVINNTNLMHYNNHVDLTLNLLTGSDEKKAIYLNKLNRLVSDQSKYDQSKHDVSIAEELCKLILLLDLNAEFKTVRMKTEFELGSSLMNANFLRLFRSNFLKINFRTFVIPKPKPPIDFKGLFKTFDLNDIKKMINNYQFVIKTAIDFFKVIQKPLLNIVTRNPSFSQTGLSHKLFFSLLNEYCSVEAFTNQRTDFSWIETHCELLFSSLESLEKLTELKTEFIETVFIPFFQHLQWLPKIICEILNNDNKVCLHKFVKNKPEKTKKIISKLIKDVEKDKQKKLESFNLLKSFDRFSIISSDNSPYHLQNYQNSEFSRLRSNVARQFFSKIHLVNHQEGNAVFMDWISVLYIKDILSGHSTDHADFIKDMEEHIKKERPNSISIQSSVIAHAQKLLAFPKMLRELESIIETEKKLNNIATEKRMSEKLIIALLSKPSTLKQLKEKGTDSEYSSELKIIILDSFIDFIKQALRSREFYSLLSLVGKKRAAKESNATWEALNRALKHLIKNRQQS